jgi:hypothetical protein
MPDQSAVIGNARGDTGRETYTNAVKGEKHESAAAECK